MSETRSLVLFILGVTAAFVYTSNVIPQIKIEAATTAETTEGASPEEVVAAGRDIFMSDRAQCLTCHSLGEDPKARCPNQEGLGARASERVAGLTAAQYLIESVYNPNAFIVPGYPKNQMTPINKAPIALTHDEILAVVTYLNSLGGTTDAAFVDEVKKVQDPWRRGILKAEEAVARASLPVFSGDADRGRELFENQGCGRCHRVGGEGPDIAPELSAIGASQSAEYLLESTLDPSAVIVKGYKDTIVMWKNEQRMRLRGTPVAWIPHKDQPKKLRLSVLEGAEPVEYEIDLDEVAQVGDTIMGVEIDGKFHSVCGEYVAGDEQSGMTLLVFENGGWVERHFPSGIRFVNYPASPMPSNYVELMTPREVYDLIAYLSAQKG